MGRVVAGPIPCRRPGLPDGPARVGGRRNRIAREPTRGGALGRFRRRRGGVSGCRWPAAGAGSRCAEHAGLAVGPGLARSGEAGRGGFPCTTARAHRSRRVRGRGRRQAVSTTGRLSAGGARATPAADPTAGASAAPRAAGTPRGAARSGSHALLRGASVEDFHGADRPGGAPPARGTRAFGGESRLRGTGVLAAGRRRPADGDGLPRACGGRQTGRPIGRAAPVGRRAARGKRQGRSVPCPGRGGQVPLARAGDKPPGGAACA